MALKDSINRSRYSEHMKAFFENGIVTAHRILYEASLRLPKGDYAARARVLFRAFARLRKGK